jgi:hypothetical protein
VQEGEGRHDNGRQRQIRSDDLRESDGAVVLRRDRIDGEKGGDGQ